MNKFCFSDHQVIKILKEVEGARTAKEGCREYGISNATYYTGRVSSAGWRPRISSSCASLSTRMLTSSRCADLSRENRALKDVIEKSSEASRREVLAVKVDINLPTARIIRGLDRIAAWRGYPSKLRMDNCPKFVSVQLAGWAEQHSVELEFIPPGKPTQNFYVKRFTAPSVMRY